MRRTLMSASLLVAMCGLLAVPGAVAAARADEAKTQDGSAHTVQFVTVEPNVKLEVLDWGGTGRPLIFLAGLGATAHVFDEVAPDLVAKYHVYGITRRGFGESSAPEPTQANYTADRMADDVLAVMDSLKIERPVLAGWSLAGEEMSSIGTRHPERVAGVIYIDAAYEYAYYDANAKQGMLPVDTAVLRAETMRLVETATAKEQKALVEHLQQVTLPRYERDLAEGKKMLDVAANAPDPPDSQETRIGLAIEAGMEPYASVKCPALALFANPHDGEELKAMQEELHVDAAAAQAMVDADNERTTAEIAAYRTGNPQVRVVVIPNANHFLFETDREQVLSEMKAFLDKLQR